MITQPLRFLVFVGASNSWHVRIFAPGETNGIDLTQAPPRPWRRSKATAVEEANRLQADNDARVMHPHIHGEHFEHIGTGKRIVARIVSRNLKPMVMRFGSGRRGRYAEFPPLPVDVFLKNYTAQSEPLGLPGRCCSCGYSGEEETECTGRDDKTHCDHWWE